MIVPENLEKYLTHLEEMWVHILDMYKKIGTEIPRGSDKNVYTKACALIYCLKKSQRYKFEKDVEEVIKYHSDMLPLLREVVSDTSIQIIDGKISFKKEM